MDPREKNTIKTENISLFLKVSKVSKIFKRAEKLKPLKWKIPRYLTVEVDR